MNYIFIDLFKRFGVNVVEVLEKFEGEQVSIPNYRLANNRFIRALQKAFADFDFVGLFKRYAGKRVRVGKAAKLYAIFISQHSNQANKLKDLQICVEQIQQNAINQTLEIIKKATQQQSLLDLIYE